MICLYRQSARVTSPGSAGPWPEPLRLLLAAFRQVQLQIQVAFAFSAPNVILPGFKGYDDSGCAAYHLRPDYHHYQCQLTLQPSFITHDNMKTFFAVLATAISAASYVAAIIPDNQPLHINSHLDSGLALALANNVPHAFVLVDSPGDSSPSDLTLFNTTAGDKVGKIEHNGLCITANGIGPGFSNDLLYVDTCSEDPAQLWEISSARKTISNADNNCITVGQDALRTSAILARCTLAQAELQEWTTFVA
ncbi:hypothetical protein OH76DRAFT_1485499 [Lentinus brumalis]|uniref:Ricin B lectin domain-containing protein n=1 Tax=Lentinus brumalis TaxID=2498619 RepID=A0A371D1K6_9APHY|nr:hypothetical protein OH76DRAFT_1485499 [Polyporus brumalis]